jgi:hypothetical protein
MEQARVFCQFGEMDDFSEEPRSESRSLGVSAPELVARAVRDIDGRDDFRRELLLSALLCAAWPAAMCQLQ